MRRAHPFHVDAWVVLPDHQPCVWTLPPGDDDFSLRWRLIKTLFAKQLPVRERRSKVRQARGERGLWQRRFWEHVIRSEQDYVHYNPVRHGYAVRTADWPFSTFRRCVERGIYAPDWGGVGAENLAVGERGIKHAAEYAALFRLRVELVGRIWGDNRNAPNAGPNRYRMQVDRWITPLRG